MGARDAEVFGLMSKVVVAAPRELAPVVAAWRLWAPGVSALNNVGKALRNLAALKQLEACKGFFRWPGCRSEYNPHARNVTIEFCRFLAVYPNSVVRREVWVEPLRRRADGILLLRREGEQAAVVLETCVTEGRASYEAKKNQWLEFAGALDFLSQQLGVKVPTFNVVGSHDLDAILGVK